MKDDSDELYEKYIGVLALFDDEDIPYINSPKYLQVMKQHEEKEKGKVLIKKSGDYYGKR